MDIGLVVHAHETAFGRIDTELKHFCFEILKWPLHIKNPMVKLCIKTLTIRKLEAYENKMRHIGASTRVHFIFSNWLQHS